MRERLTAGKKIEPIGKVEYRLSEALGWKLHDESLRSKLNDLAGEEVHAGQISDNWHGEVEIDTTNDRIIVWVYP